MTSHFIGRMLVCSLPTMQLKAGFEPTICRATSGFARRNALQPRHLPLESSDSVTRGYIYTKWYISHLGVVKVHFPGVIVATRQVLILWSIYYATRRSRIWTIQLAFLLRVWVRFKVHVFQRQKYSQRFKNTAVTSWFWQLIVLPAWEFIRRPSCYEEFVYLYT